MHWRGTGKGIVDTGFLRFVRPVKDRRFRGFRVTRVDQAAGLSRGPCDCEAWV